MIDIKKLAAAKNRAEIQAVFSEHKTTLFYKGRVQAKERPRMTKGGRVFTPKETKQFERSVRKWAKGEVVKPVSYPIRVLLNVYEQHDDTNVVQHSALGLTFNQKGDIDNLAKSVLDGMNGVVYKDDKQIVDLHITRRYSVVAGFDVTITRAGLSSLEYTNFCKRANR